MANTIDPDATAHYELSYLDLHCLQTCPNWSAEIKGLIFRYYNFHHPISVQYVSSLSPLSVRLCCDRFDAQYRKMAFLPYANSALVQSDKCLFFI